VPNRRAAERTADGEIQCIIGAVAKPITKPTKEAYAAGGTQEKLGDPRQEEGLPGFFELFHIDLKANHKEQNDDTDFGDGADIGFASHQPQAYLRTDEYPRRAT